MNDSKADSGNADLTEVYNSIAASYFYRWVNSDIADDYRDKFSEYVTPKGTILDVGCGIGRDVVSFTSRGFECIGFDQSLAMLSWAKALAPQHNFRQTTFASLHLPEASADGLWCSAIAQHLEINVLANLLFRLSMFGKNGAILYISLPLLKENRIDNLGRATISHSEDVITEIIRRAGFDILSTEQREYKKERHKTNPGPWLIVFAKNNRRHNQDSSECPFCHKNRFSANIELGLPNISSIIMCRNNMFLVPDISPLRPGHLLIISERHIPSMRNAPFPIEIMNSVRAFHRNTYGLETMFVEHGGTQGEVGAGCIAHAHIHCIPASKQDFLKAKNLSETLSETRSLAAPSTSCESPYVWMKFGDDEHTLDAANLPRQFIRMAIVRGDGAEEIDYNWAISADTKLSKNLFISTLNEAINSENFRNIFNSEQDDE